MHLWLDWVKRGRAVELPAANCIHRCRMDPVTCQNILTPPNPENIRPHIATLLKMQPHYSQSSREKATPTSGTSLLACY